MSARYRDSGDVEGLDGLLAGIDEAAELIATGGRLAIEGVAESAAAELADVWPEVTGATAASLRGEGPHSLGPKGVRVGADKRGVYALFGTRLFYARMVNKGTKYIRGHRLMEKTLARVRRELTPAMAREMRLKLVAGGRSRKVIGPRHRR